MGTDDGFFDTSDDHESLVVRPKEMYRSGWLRGQCDAVRWGDGVAGVDKTGGIYGASGVCGCGKRGCEALCLLKESDWICRLCASQQIHLLQELVRLLPQRKRDLCTNARYR